MRRPVVTLIAALTLAALSVPALTADQILIPAGSAWRYNDTGTNLGTAWRATGFNDAAWASGNAQLGYGDGDESTLISYGTSTSNRRITYYFRTQFTVANPAAVAALTLRFVRDDGAVIYLNGDEVVAVEHADGNDHLHDAGDDGDRRTPTRAPGRRAPVDPSLLVAGTNVIAVEIHQQSPTSTDVSFDLELTRDRGARPRRRPSACCRRPTSGVTNSTSVTFTASATAPAGLASATLYVGGPPQTVDLQRARRRSRTRRSPPTRRRSPTAAAPSINVDGQTPHAHGLLKFPTLIGSGGGQVPAGAIVTSAMLQLNCTNPGNMMRLYRLTQSWIENEATWNQRATGVAWAIARRGRRRLERRQLPDRPTAPPPALRSIDITQFVQDWSNGAPNYGVVLTDTGTDGIDFGSSESGDARRC